MKEKFKLCVHCGVNNPHSAIFCRGCGLPFDVKLISEKNPHIPEINKKWEKYSSWKKPITGVCIRFLGVIIFSIFVFFLAGILTDSIKDIPDIVPYLSATFFSLISVLLGWLLIRRQLPTKEENGAFEDIYDCIEPYCYTGIAHSRKRKLFKRFLKGDKMGLMDVTNYKISIEPKYTEMRWKEKQKILIVSMNDDNFDIDINGNFV